MPLGAWNCFNRISTRFTVMFFSIKAVTSWISMLKYWPLHPTYIGGFGQGLGYQWMYGNLYGNYSERFHPYIMEIGSME
jgi:hypothetical protein